MINLKLSSIAAGAGFLLSFLVSLITGARLPGLILRPILFAFIFFITGSGAYMLIKRFLGELFEGGETGIGANVDLTIDDDYGLKASDAQGASQDAYGDFDGLEQMSTKHYNTGEEVEGEAESFGESYASSGGGARDNSAPALQKLSGNLGQNADPKKMASAIQHLLLDDD